LPPCAVAKGKRRTSAKAQHRAQFGRVSILDAVASERTAVSQVNARPACELFEAMAPASAPSLAPPVLERQRATLERSWPAPQA
jgi:hypothetical protein